MHRLGRIISRSFENYFCSGMSRFPRKEWSQLGKQLLLWRCFSQAKTVFGINNAWCISCFGLKELGVFQHILTSKSSVLALGICINLYILKFSSLLFLVPRNWGDGSLVKCNRSWFAMKRGNSFSSWSPADISFQLSLLSGENFPWLFLLGFQYKSLLSWL